MAILHIDAQGGSDLSLLKSEYYTNPGVLSPVLWSYSLGRSRFDDKFINENKNYYSNPIETTYEFGDILVYWHCYGDGKVSCNVKARGSLSNLISFTHDNSGSRPVIEYYLDFAIDTELHKGYFVVISLQHIPYEGNNWQEFIWLADGGATLYNLLVNTSDSGGAGSGYIGNSLLSNKKMVGYNVPTSSAEGTKTESVNDVSASAVSDKPKSGNGFARIKFLRDFEPPEEYRQYLDTINGTGFFFRDWPQVHNDEWNIDYYPHYPLYNQSYKSYGGSSDFNSGSPWIEETTKGIASLYITEQQTGWGYDTTFEAYDWVYWATTPNNRTQIGIINKTNQCILGRSGSSYGWDTDATHNRTDTTGHGYESLSALFYDITRLYRNVNIYVNGILWSSALTQ